jgi:hypothetical protein
MILDKLCSVQKNNLENIHENQKASSLSSKIKQKIFLIHLLKLPSFFGQNEMGDFFQIIVTLSQCLNFSHLKACYSNTICKNSATKSSEKYS